MTLRLRLRTAGATGGGGIGPGGGAGKVIPAEYFGLHIGSLAPTTIWGDYSASAAAAYRQVPWPDMPVGTIRLWDSNGCTWRNIERSRGVYTWGRMDFAMAQAQAHGAAVIYCLGCGPDWATTKPGQRAGMYVGYNPHPPADLADWARWCAAFAARYAGRGIVYEPWNEVNDAAFGPDHVGSGYVGTMQQLLDLSRVMRDTIRPIDPTARFATPNFVGEGGLVAPSVGRIALESYLAAGGAQYADVVSMHAYNTLSPWPEPEGAFTFGQQTLATMQAAGVTLPLWSTEWGYGRWRGTDGAIHEHPERMDEDLGAAFASRLAIIGWLAGYERNAFYALDGVRSYNTIVMVDPVADPAVLLKPARAWGYAATLLTGGRLSGHVEAVDATGRLYHRATFTTASGRVGRVLWCQNYQTAQVATTGVVEARDCVGAALPLTSSMTIGHAPTFLFATPA